MTGLAPASFMRKYIEAGVAEDIWWNVTDLGYLTYHVAQALAQCKISGKPGAKTLAFRATGLVHRLEYGMKAGFPAISNDVDLIVTTEGAVE